MSGTINFRHTYMKLHNILRTQFPEMIDVDFTADNAVYESEFDTLLKVVRKLESCHLRINQNAMQAVPISQKVWMKYLKYARQDYAGYSFYDLMKLAPESKNEIISCLLSLLVIVKQAKVAKDKITQLIKNASTFESEINFQHITVIWNKAKDILAANKDVDVIIQQMNGLREEYKSVILQYFKIGIQLVNEDLIGYIDISMFNHKEFLQLVDDDTISFVESYITTGNVPWIGDYDKLMIYIARVISIIPKPRPSGKFKYITEVLTSIAKYARSKDSKKWIKPSLFRNLEAIVEMLIFPFLSGKLTGQLAEIRSFVNLDKKSLANIIKHNSGSVPIIKGLKITRNPLLIESEDKELWPQVYVDAMNDIIKARKWNDNIRWQDMPLGNKIREVVNLYLEHINAEFHLNYSFEYIKEIIESIIDD